MVISRLRSDEVDKDMAEKLVLHTCCAPCLLYPYKVLSEMGFELVSLWYNPNIFPYSEKMRRYECLKEYCRGSGIELVSIPSMPEDFYRAVFTQRDIPTRCGRCWYLRLKRTARECKRLGISKFTTTLLVSKYQDPEVINALGQRVAQEEGVEYLAFDFRDGFNWAHQRAKELGLYMQKWCGCLFSYNARKRALLRRKKKKEGVGI